MKRERTRHLGRMLLLLFFVCAPQVASASQATPAGSSEGITLAASGLDSPRGFTWGPDGTLYVTQAGTSGAGVPASTPVVVSPNWIGTLNGSVAYVDQGCPVIFQGNLPSSGGVGAMELGPVDVAVLNGLVYVLDEGGGEAHGNPLTPDGIYAIDGSGSARLIADIGAWVKANPVANPPENLDVDGDVVAMVASGGSLWVLEGNSGQLLQVTPDGTITRVADLSEGNRFPRGLAAASDGSLYVGFRTQEPIVEGAASVAKITPDGTVTEVWTGLTAVNGVAVGPDGALYALELGTPDESQPFSIAPDSGRVLRQTGPDSAREIANGIDLPWSLAFGPDQGLYVGLPSIGSSPTNGAVIRLNLSQGHVMTMSDAVLAASPCLPAPTPTPETTAAASPTASTGTPEAGTPESADGVAVEIQNFEYSPNSVTVAVGTTVTWTNHDTSPHTVTAQDGSFSSGTISPGDTFTYTFTDAGTFDYVCDFHPGMAGTVVVQ